MKKRPAARSSRRSLLDSQSDNEQARVALTFYSLFSDEMKVCWGWLRVLDYFIPVEPHEAVAEVSKI